jgi:hypothetical protein
MYEGVTLLAGLSATCLLIERSHLIQLNCGLEIWSWADVSRCDRARWHNVQYITVSQPAGMPHKPISAIGTVLSTGLRLTDTKFVRQLASAGANEACVRAVVAEMVRCNLACKDIEEV